MFILFRTIVELCPSPVRPPFTPPPPASSVGECTLVACRRKLPAVANNDEQYNGAKQLYVNRALVYTVKKECTDGNMNSWVVKLSFGSVVLSLISKLFSSSGFEYALTFGGDGTQLYKSTQ